MRHPIALAALALLACRGSAGQRAAETRPVARRDAGSMVVVPADATEVFSSSPKATACTYAGRIIARCEAMLGAPRFEAPGELLTDAARFDAEVAARESAYIESCMSRGMSRTQAEGMMLCLNGIGHCGTLRHCVGSDFRGGDPDEERQIGVMFQAPP